MIDRAGLVLVIVVALMATGRAQSQAESSAAGLMLGILREDSVLVPFAAFDGQAWTAAWYKLTEGPGKVVPQRVADIPSGWWAGRAPATEWELLGGGGVRRRIGVSGVTRYQSHCVDDGVGLMTHHSSPVRVEPHRWPIPYAGIVSTTPKLLGRVERIREGSAAFEAINQELPQIFRRLEPEVWKELPVNPASSQAVPELYTVYSARLPDGRELLTFSAARAMPRSTNPIFDEKVTRMIGWFSRRGSSAWQLVDARGSQSDIDWKGGDDTFNPIATLTLGGRTFWVGTADGYEWETYVVVEVTSGVPKQLVSAEAGRC